MAAVNTDGTFVNEGGVVKMDTGGTQFEAECAATEFGIEVSNNTRSHPRTGCKAPYDEIIDATYSFVFKYAHGFGTDGIYNMLAALSGTEVAFEIDTDGSGGTSASAPVISFTAKVPYLSPLPVTAIGEFAAGEITIPLPAAPTVATA